MAPLGNAKDGVRRSRVAYVLVKLKIRGQEYLLLNAHPKWGDWSLLGGHVEPSDSDLWAAAARETSEELAPLRYGEDVEVQRDQLDGETGELDRPSVGQCDCIIVDECHRGYLLDRELSDQQFLVPYSERVDHAVRRIRKARPFTEAQAKWLERIAKQLKLETVVDRAALDSGQFKAEGGFTRLNRIFDGQLEALLGELADQTWKDAG